MPDIKKPIYHAWEPITDLSGNYISLSNQKFAEISEKWLEIKPFIKDDVYYRFLSKIKNEWVIELGNVENIYFINDKITQALVEEGLYSIDIPHQGSPISPIDPKAFFTIMKMYLMASMTWLNRKHQLVHI